MAAESTTRSANPIISSLNCRSNRADVSDIELVAFIVVEHGLAAESLLKKAVVVVRSVGHKVDDGQELVGRVRRRCALRFERRSGR